MKKTALVSGANKGIGLEITRQLAQRAYRVFLTARNVQRGEAAAAALRKEGLDVEFIPLDVADSTSIQAARREIGSRCEGLTVLINNAGILIDSNRNILALSEAEIRNTMNINALGPLFLTQAFADLLVDGGRVVNVSSGGGAICGGASTWAPIYCISKTTENAITMQLAHALADRQILVNAVCPGWVQTDMGGSGATRSIPEGADTPLWLATAEGLRETGKFYRDRQIISW
ncbi:MAG: SDR family NAD(P)-dependent oxidoreductase [Bacteroidota bacterium]|mgnify:CR=1 FL=1